MDGYSYIIELSINYAAMLEVLAYTHCRQRVS